MFSLFLISLISCYDSAGIGGFITFKFPFSGDKSALLSQITIVVKTPQGSLIDTAEVQPTGYWIVPTPENRELVISVRSPSGIVFSPPSIYTQFPFNSDINFQILGFSILGNIVTNGPNDDLIHVSAPLQVKVTNGKDITITNVSSSDGSFVVSPLPPGEYSVSLIDAIASSKTVKITDKSEQCDPLLITDWPQNGFITFPDSIQSKVIKLQLSGPVSREFETDENGKFSISGLTVGDYKITSKIKDIIIAPLSFSILTSKLPSTLSTEFEGIRVHGKISFPDGKPLKGVEVVLSPGNVKTVSDANGLFEFSPVKPISQPHISLKYPYHTFSVPQIPPIEFTPINDIEIRVVNAQICGKVECEQAKLKFSGAIQDKFVVKNGTFCVSAPISKAVEIKAKSECGFENKVLTVTAPTDSVKFARIKASVSGSAKCIGECDTNTIIEIKNDQYKYQTNLLSNGEFHISEVEYGNYRLHISGNKNQEWKTLINGFVVDDKEIRIGNACIQSSFLYNVTASHEMEVKCDNEIIKLNRGLNNLKVKSTVIEPADCHIFKAIDLKNNQRIIVESIKRNVEVSGDEGTYSVFLNGVQLQAPYTFLQKLDEVVTIEVKTNSPYFAEPSKIDVQSVTSCADCPIKFEVLRGIEFHGKITPAVEGATISAISQNKIISTAISDSNGEYSLGSFHSNINVELKASYNGYKISRIDNTFDFTSQKLSSVVIVLNFSSNVDPKGILFSISRDNGFALNVLNDDETTLIGDLEPGKYYLKPIFREHEFYPPQVSFELLEGSNKEIRFDIKRVKFGICGDVRRITGEVEPDVEIEAKYPNGDKQTAITDAKGRFRIGGLQPNQTITLYARASSTSSVEKITPSQMSIKMGNEEYKGVHFISMKSSHTFDIFGELHVNPDFLTTMSIALMNSQGRVVDRFTFPSKFSNFFYFNNLTEDTYTVHTANTFQINSFNCTHPEVKYLQPHANVVVECQIINEQTETHSHSPVAAITISIILIIIWISYFNFGSIKRIYNDTRPKKARKNHSSSKGGKSD